MSNSAFTPSVLTITQSGTTGSGQGELNVISNPSAVTDLSGWTATGLTPSRDTSGSPLDPTVPTGFSLSTSASGQTYVSTVTVPASLRNRKLKLEFYFSQSTSSYKVDVLNSSSVRFPLTTDVSSVSNIPAISGGSKYTTYFDMDSGSTISVRFTSIASSGVLKFTQLIVGPGIQPQGAVVGEWQSYTGTVANGGTATFAYISRLWRRVGDSIEIKYGFGVTANGSGSNIVKVPMPSNLTVDLSSMPNETAVGFYSKYNGTQLVAGAAMRTVTATTDGVAFQEVGTADSIFGSDLVNGHSYYINFTVKVSEWAGSGTVQLAQNDVEWAYNTTAWGTDNTSSNFGYGPGGASITGSLSASLTQRVTFQTPIQVGDDLSVEISSDGKVWRRSDTFMDASGNPVINSYSTLATGNSSAGVYLKSVSSSTTQLDVVFMRYASLANDDSPVVDWQNGWKWRVRKSSAGAAVGFGIVSPGVSSGLVSASGLPGNTTGNAIAAGYVGESANLGTAVNVTPGASGNYANAVTFNLNKGVYLILARGEFTLTSTSISGLTVLACAISTTSNNVDASAQRTLIPTSIAINNDLTPPTRLLVVTADNTPVYLVNRMDYSSVGTAKIGGWMQAIRIA